MSAKLGSRPSKGANICFYFLSIPRTRDEDARGMTSIVEPDADDSLFGVRRDAAYAMTLVAADVIQSVYPLQNYEIFPHLNVEDNIGFGIRKSGLSKLEIAQKIEEILELIKLQGMENVVRMSCSADKGRELCWRGHWSNNPKCCC